MAESYKKLEARIKRRNRRIRAVFLMDTAEAPIPTAVYDVETNESLDSIRGTGPRPLKTHAYQFSYLEDAKGRPLLEGRVTNAHEAEAFAKRILKAAHAITREQYLRELDAMIWPQERTRLNHIDSALSSKSFALMRDIEHPMLRLPSIALPAPSEESTRKKLIRDIIELVPELSEEDMRSLLKYAQLLHEE